jgi:hypothetical protein
LRCEKCACKVEIIYEIPRTAIEFIPLKKTDKKIKTDKPKKVFQIPTTMYFPKLIDSHQ